MGVAVRSKANMVRVSQDGSRDRHHNITAVLLLHTNMVNHHHSHTVNRLRINTVLLHFSNMVLLSPSNTVLLRHSSMVLPHPSRTANTEHHHRNNMALRHHQASIPQTKEHTAHQADILPRATDNLLLRDDIQVKIQTHRTDNRGIRLRGSMVGVGITSCGMQKERSRDGTELEMSPLVLGEGRCDYLI